jgi:hypothetical protein
MATDRELRRLSLEAGVDVQALRQFEKDLKGAAVAPHPARRVTQTGLPLDALPIVIDPRVREGPLGWLWWEAALTALGPGLALVEAVLVATQPMPNMCCKLFSSLLAPPPPPRPRSHSHPTCLRPSFAPPYCVPLMSHPRSGNGQASFLARWDLVTSLCLLFTATVTPVEVAFLDTSFNTLYFINRVVDVIFLVVRVSAACAQVCQHTVQGQGCGRAMVCLGWGGGGGGVGTAKCRLAHWQGAAHHHGAGLGCRRTLY